MDINYRIQPLGAEMQFLLPSLRLRQKGLSNVSPEVELERFFEKNGLVFTADVGNIWGTWKDRHGRMIVGEHRRYTVAFDGDEIFQKVCAFLATLALQLQEECIYCVREGKGFLIWPPPIKEEGAE